MLHILCPIAREFLNAPWQADSKLDWMEARPDAGCFLYLVRGRKRGRRRRNTQAAHVKVGRSFTE